MIFPDESPGEVSDHQSGLAGAPTSGHGDPDTEAPGLGVSSDHLDHLMTVIVMKIIDIWHHYMITTLNYITPHSRYQQPYTLLSRG